MNDAEKIKIEHFSDVLCIWAYIAQIRIDELKAAFTDRVELKYHFFPVFGSVENNIKNLWADKGGYEAYNRHVLEIASRYEHVEVSENIWLSCKPKTSISAHVFLKAIQLVQAARQQESGPVSWLENYAWQLRLTFFKETLDISDLDVQVRLAEEQGLPVDDILKMIKSGEAFAALDQDTQLRSKYLVQGSPTLIFNEGRQILYGNVGYRVIEANIKELLRQPELELSWC